MAAHQQKTDIKDSALVLQGNLQKHQKYLAQQIPETFSSLLRIERVVKMILSSAGSKGSMLLQCDPMSIVRSAGQALAMGLEPCSPLQQAYLVPFRNQQRWEAQLIIGYRGYIALARRSGQIESVSAHSVHDNDEFEVALGTDESILHKPNYRKDRGESYAYYSVAKFVGGGRYVEVMGRHEVNGIRDRSSAYTNAKNKSVTPWHRDYDEMAKKTVIRRASKYWPLCVELLDAMDAEDKASRDLGIDMDKVIEAEPSVAPANEDATDSIDASHDAETGEIEQQDNQQPANENDQAKAGIRRMREELEMRDQG